MKNILESALYISDLQKASGKINLSCLTGKSILITGGLGLIGSAVVDLLLVSDVSCQIYIAASHRDVFDQKYSQIHRVRYIQYDALEEIDFYTKFDYIIHGAGIANPSMYITHPVETMMSNMKGLYNLLQYAKQTDAQRVLYISSSEVYGNKLTADAFVEDEFGSVNINTIRASYAEAKRASEVLCRAFQAECGVDTVIVRPGHIFGPTASAKDSRIVSAFTSKAAKGETLTMKSAGNQMRSYCYVIDCAVALLFVLLKGQNGESYNIGHDEVTTIRRMAEIVAEAGNVPLVVEAPSESEQAAFNPMINSSLNHRKIKNLGYHDTFSVKEGLFHTVSILKEIYTN